MSDQYQAQTLSLPADLFTLGVHPDKPLIAAGLASGHVYAYSWAPADAGASANEDDDSDDETPESKSTETPFTVSWKTRRHKTSCRSIVFSADGSALFSVGTDKIIKTACAETGRVTAKAAISDDGTSILNISPEHLLVGTDSGAIFLYDLRTAGDFKKSSPVASWKTAHDDYISSLLALPASNTSITGHSRQFVATGDTTLTHLDVRKPGEPLKKSEDQEDEILCSAFIANAPSRQTGGSQKILTGTSAGVVTAWTKGFWDDHQDRIPLARQTGDAVESLLALPSDYKIPGEKGWGTYFAAGSGDGKVRIVKMGNNKTLATLAHSFSTDEAKTMFGGKIIKGDYQEGLEEGVSALALDCDGRVVTGGGMVVKVWTPMEDQEMEEAQAEKRKNEDSDSDQDSDDASDDSDDSIETEKKRHKKKKRKGGKGKAKSVGVKNVNSFKGMD